MLEHTHAIIIIKNDKDEYLQYYDNRWNCFLFPNCKLSNDNHIKQINDYLSSIFSLNIQENQINYIMDKVHEKFSESAGKIKLYHHYFYKVESCAINNKEDNFFNAKDHIASWFSLNKLENDERIQKVNSDIVQFVKEIKL